MTRSRHNPIDRILGDSESRRRKYAGALTSANRAILDGIEQLAEHERSAIKVHYKQAQTGLRTFRQGGSPRDLALTQAELLQNTATRMLANTRQSLTILDNTRREASSRVRTHLSDPGAYKSGTEEAGTTAPPTAKQAPPTPAPRPTPAPTPKADIAAQEAGSNASSRPTARKSGHSTQSDKAHGVSSASPEDTKPTVNETFGDAKTATKKRPSSSTPHSGASRRSDSKSSPGSAGSSEPKTTTRRAGSRKSRPAQGSKTPSGDETSPTQSDTDTDSKSSTPSKTAGDKSQPNDDHHSSSK